MTRFRPPMLQLPFDLLRWGFETLMREGLPPDEPELVRLLAGVGWRLEARLTRGRWAMLVDEVRRTFRVSVRTAESAAREAYDVGLQARLEELIVPRLGPETLTEWARVRGTVAPGSLVVYPHAGSLPVLVAALAWAHPGLVVFRARGVAPPDRRAIGSIAPTLVNRHLALRHGEEDSRLPVRWTNDPADIAHTLRSGGIAAAAFDDRAWPTYRPSLLLGREALLSPDPWDIAAAAGVPVVPAFVHRELDKTHVVELRPPIAPDLGTYLRDHAEPWLRNNPGHYADWLGSCRIRAGVDDHPLFPDYAQDLEWHRWRPLHLKSA